MKIRSKSTIKKSLHTARAAGTLSEQTNNCKKKGFFTGEELLLASNTRKNLGSRALACISNALLLLSS